MANDGRNGHDHPRRTGGGDYPRRSGASQPGSRRVIYGNDKASAYQGHPGASSAGHSDAPPPRAPRGPSRRFRIFDLLIIALAVALVVFLVKPLLELSESAANPDDPNTTLGPPDIYPIITEIMASNGSALCDSRGEYSDWIEITNPTNQTLNLSGYALSDDVESPDQFIFPALVLEPDQSVIVFASGVEMEQGAEEISTPFRLSRSGETVVLLDPYDNPVDEVTFGLLETDMSWARDPDNRDVWAQTAQYTPGFPNDEAGWQAFSQTRRVADSPVVINEVMTGNKITLTDEEGEYWDWIELYNRGNEAVDLSGYGLSDREESPRRWILPSVTIQPGQYLVVFASGKDRTDPQKTLHASFRLNSIKETVVLCNQRGIILDSVAIGELVSDTSTGRVDGSEVWEVFTAPTPGYPNNEQGFNDFQEKQLSQTNSQIIISEVMSGNSSTLEDDNEEYPDWIEIYNRGSDPISLAGYGLSNSTDQLAQWIFPDKTLEPGEFLVVFASGRSQSDPGAQLHTNFMLSSQGEPVVLTDPSGAVADKCLLSVLPFNMSYGRTQTSLAFSYMDEPTPGAANGGGWPGFAPQPQFVLPGGCYESAQQIEITAAEGVSIHYTLNGEEPTGDSPLYTGPLPVTEPTVIRVMGVRQGLLPSPVATRSYLIGISHTLPVVNITSDPANLWSDEKGILALGDNAKDKYPFKGANFWQEWEVPAYVEMYDQNGYAELSQGFALRVFGAYSRANDAKCLALMARSQYGPESFAAAVFPDLPFTEYQSLVLRNGASEWNVAKMRDVLITSLAKDTTDLDVQAFRPCVVYLNAQYYGVFYFREKLNKHYIAQHYGVDPESVNILVGNSTVQVGSNADYKELLKFAKENDLTDAENYAYIQTRMDIDNYIDMVICEMYCGNTDTGNIKYWMSEEYDGRWRWFFYDVDWSFLISHVSDDMVGDYLNPDGIGVSNMFDNTLIVKLIQNTDFRAKFLDRFAYHINVTFNPERVIQRIDQIEALIDAEMPRDKEKWGYGTYEGWKKQVDRLRDFATQRPDYVKQHVKTNFGLTQDELDALLAQ